MTKFESVAASSHDQGNSLKQADRFPDLRAGGRELAVHLKLHRSLPDLIVLGIALGGVPVAHEVATHLRAPLDFVIVRRLLVESPDSQRCAVSVAGSMILDEGIQFTPNPSTPLEYFLHDAITEVEQRTQTWRQKRAPVSLADRNVILVDCGIRTGSTMKASVPAIRKLNPKQIIAAVPVSSREGYAAVAPLCDELICLSQPEQFINAGYWYRDFRRPGDDEVGALLE